MCHSHLQRSHETWTTARLNCPFPSGNSQCPVTETTNPTLWVKHTVSAFTCGAELAGSGHLWRSCSSGTGGGGSFSPPFQLCEPFLSIRPTAVVLGIRVGGNLLCKLLSQWARLQETCLPVNWRSTLQNSSTAVPHSRKGNSWKSSLAREPPDYLCISCPRNSLRRQPMWALSLLLPFPADRWGNRFDTWPR